ncbi:MULTISPECIES: hypothetical protein [unclassified Methylobacterium]|jgi:predicted amidohydrolase|uniref:hypothetical protein n=1 Tax=unclassified Methylobacterium TaxID=2615210 RepID=UPI0008EDCE81|nr:MULTISPECIES: hypothetical protein [unclassified Methylobacterium]MDE4909568.1 hypothetical protein [Methylobacterium sp. 092160098-2]SFU93475.1 Predicted amidohydrolase [Methylobacterium sp. UNCCL125]
MLTQELLGPHLQGLGDLFALLWQVVVPHTGVLHTVPWRGRAAAEYAPLAAAARQYRGTGTPDVFIRYLLGEPVAFHTEIAPAAEAERAFTIMLVIDLLAHDVHPASVVISASSRAPAPCRAASQLRQRRWIDGHYGGGIAGTGRVVPKGPIYRRLLDEDEMASGDRLDTQFTSLALLEVGAGQYTINIEAVAPKDFPAGHDPADAAAPSIGIAPVAEDRDDLAFDAVLRQGRPFLDARPRDPGELAARTVAVVRALGSADIVLLPELCVSADAVVAVMEDLVAAAGLSGAPAPRLIALGSGLSAQCCPTTSRPYNECSIVDANGRVLWKQRKLNHFRMGEQRMGECNILTAVARPHAEDVATGTVLQVRDLPHFGRVMVLICEDLEQRAPGGDAAYALRPDWILTPVLDVAQSAGRWTHQRAIEIARLSGTRILVSNSATLAVRQANGRTVGDVAASSVGIGLCIDMTESRRMKVVTLADCTISPISAQFDWDPTSWDRWTIVVR